MAQPLRIVLCVALAATHISVAQTQIKAQLPKTPATPPWNKGILPISRESYWNAVECGK